MLISNTAIRRVLFLSGLVVFATAVAISAAPQSELLDERWERHDPRSDMRVDNSDWAWFLSEYLITDDPSGVHLIPYAEIGERSRTRLQRYISELESVPVSRLNRDEQMAYWLNLYNAVTVELILEHYPVESIRDINISGPFFNRHPWDAELVEVEGEELSLNNIEHNIIRPIWEDERIHYVVNCAAMDCPVLHYEPFIGENYDRLFDEAARRYINSPSGFSHDDGRPVFSSIFDWYEGDFGNGIEDVVAHMLEYAEGETRRQLLAYRENGYSPRARYEYDWALIEGSR